LKFLNFAKRSPISGALVSLSIRAVRGNQDVSDAAARLGLGTNSQLMQPNFKQFTVRKLDAHSFSNMPLIQSSRVDWDIHADVIVGRLHAIQSPSTSKVLTSAESDQ